MTASFDWMHYTGNLAWLPSRTIYLTRHGSRAYGTSLPTSDLDLRGICIAPKPHYFGFVQRFEQALQAEPDLCVFELRKFLKLASDCNPNALELLFTSPEDHLQVTALGAKLLEHRDLFLSQKAKGTFSGYAHSQMKRIKTHRHWLLHPAKTQPQRSDFGLPERTSIPADQMAAAQATIKKKVDSWAWRSLENVSPDVRIELQSEFTRRLIEISHWGEESIEANTWNSAAAALGFDSNFIELMDLERRYQGGLRNFNQYQEWKANRNQARAGLEAQFGFDCKHASHLVRLARSCKELLLTGKLNVRRPDAEELLFIRNGGWDFEILETWFEKQVCEIEEAAKVSTLPKRPDLAAIDALCSRLVEASFS